MLVEQPRHGVRGRIGVLTRNPTFTRLLLAILAEWRYAHAAELAGNDVVLAERGLVVPPGPPRIIWLSPLDLDTESHLRVPLVLSKLYQCLEQQFYLEPRRHLRLPLDQPVDLNVRGALLAGRLLSISARGARVSSAVLLPKGEKLSLDFKLENYPLRLHAQVIYNIPAGDVDGRDNPQAGLLFSAPKPGLCRFIEMRYVALACEKIGLAANDPCLSWLDLAENLWASLEC